MEPPADVEDTVLTERQAEVLALRAAGHTQREIADRFGTSVANVSSLEGSARGNVERARRTLSLARLLEAPARFTAEAGTGLRALVDRVYEEGNEAGLKVAYPSTELGDHLRAHLGDRLEGGALTAPVEVGITDDGDVVVHPSAVDPFDG